MITSNAGAPLQYQIPFRCSTAIVPKLEIRLQRAVVAAITDYRGGLISGPTGTGKTYTLVAAMREPSTRQFEDAAMFVDWPEFTGDVDRWRAMRGDDREKFDPMRRLCFWRGPLFVDDVGQEQAVESGYRAGETESLFDQFVNRRTGMDLPLWITTNLASDDIRKRYGERAISRLAEHCLEIPLGGDDRRLTA
jgi:DNA replication protein DnaC